MKVNTTKKYDTGNRADGWVQAARLTEKYLLRPGRADELLAVAGQGMDARDAARCQLLFYGVLRNLSLIRVGLDSLCPRRPAREAEALLMVAGFELLDAGDDAGQRAKVTHNAVGKARAMLPDKMSGFVNAVLRRLPDAFAGLAKKNMEPLERLALLYSHPLWLVRRWAERFGPEDTEKLLRWDQQPPTVSVRLEEGTLPPACLSPTRWPGYYTYDGGGWGAVAELLAARKAYAQDPSTRLCVEMLAPKPGMRVLDLCAAPGGKARQMIPMMLGRDEKDCAPSANSGPAEDKAGKAVAPGGTLVCVDLPGGRCERLRENLAGPNGGLRVEVVESDVFDLCAEKFRTLGLPEQYDAVLLDAPCSNTGVLRRRPDARWRLKETDFQNCARLQAKLLAHAASLLAPGGRMVYSTCSIDDEENAAVTDAFLKASPQFKETGRITALPWMDAHDGAGVAAFENA
ncbi:MAG: RsmB/NOP family class I SAM-dependent RNA methyltransferase [Opitutales bacterium]|jgi:16S rRNA (cytosine967-C5)-methyltransferase